MPHSHSERIPGSGSRNCAIWNTPQSNVSQQDRDGFRPPLRRFIGWGLLWVRGALVSRNRRGRLGNRLGSGRRWFEALGYLLAPDISTKDVGVFGLGELDGL